MANNPYIREVVPFIVGAVILLPATYLLGFEHRDVLISILEGML